MTTTPTAHQIKITQLFNGTIAGKGETLHILEGSKNEVKRILALLVTRYASEGNDGWGARFSVARAEDAAALGLSEAADGRWVAFVESPRGGETIPVFFDVDPTLYVE